MQDFDQKNERTILVNELENALTRLESSLTEASRAIITVRSCIPQVTALVDVVNTMESAMTFARQRLGTGSVAESAPIHAVPPPPAVQPAFQPAPEPEPQTEAEPPVVTEGAPTQFCLRLRVGSKAGALDLKAVDNAVNEQQAVTDVALIDYDGRQATLRVWISGSDGEAARTSLEESLRSRLGGEDAAEIEIEFEERAAA